MPSKSKAQHALTEAAAHGATFAKAKEIRASMSLAQIGDFTATSPKGLPAHVKKAGHPARNLGAHLHKRKGR